MLDCTDSLREREHTACHTWWRSCQTKDAVGTDISYRSRCKHCLLLTPIQQAQCISRKEPDCHSAPHAAAAAAAADTPQLPSPTTTTTATQGHQQQLQAHVRTWTPHHTNSKPSMDRTPWAHSHESQVAEAMIYFAPVTLWHTSKLLWDTRAGSLAISSRQKAIRSELTPAECMISTHRQASSWPYLCVH